MGSVVPLEDDGACDEEDRDDGPASPSGECGGDGVVGVVDGAMALMAAWADAAAQTEPPQFMRSWMGMVRPAQVMMNMRTPSWGLSG